MWSQFLRSLLVIMAVFMMTLPAHALVFMGRLEPGTIALGAGWPEEQAFRELLNTQKSIGGHFLDAPTWWDGHFAVTYLYRGREVTAQRMINELNRLKLPNTTVTVIDDEGFDLDNWHLGSNQPLHFDWNLQISETKSVRADREVLPGMNARQIHMTIYLGDRLDRKKLRIPEWMQPKRVAWEGGPQPDTEPGPVSAFQAIARAARDD